MNKSTKKYTNFDEVARDINALYDAVNKPQQSVGSGSEGKSGDLRLTFDDGGYAYIEGKGNEGWLTSFTGVMVDKPAIGRPYPHFPYLEVDNFFAKMFTIKQTQAFNGDYLMSAGTGVVEFVTSNTITFKDQTNLNACPFVVNDKCEINSINPSTGLSIRLVQFTITAVSGRVVTVTYTGANRPVIGDIVVVKGNSSNVVRQNSIFFATNVATTPYIDLYTGTTGFTFGTPKVSIGDMTHITDADFGGALVGDGAYLTNAYIKGKIYLANNGSVSLGKTAYNDTTNAGFWLGDSDATATVNPYFYLGSASDAKYLKVDTVAGTFNTFGFDISAGSIKSTSTMTYARGVAGTEFGYWLGIDTVGKFFIGSSATKQFTYDGTDLSMVGGTITGGTIISATTGGRMIINGNSIQFYNGVDNYGGILINTSDNYIHITDQTVFDAYANLTSGFGISTYFTVNSTGQLTKINNITYAFPSVAPTLNQVLTCTNATGGVLGWSTPTTGTVTGSGTINELAYWTGASSLGTLTTVTYPSLTEISYVKGLTSLAQNQIDSKQATLVSGTNIKTVNSTTLLGSGNLAVGTVTSIATTAPITGGTITSTGTIALDLTAAISWTGEHSFTKFKLNAEVSHSVTGTGNYDCTDKNVIILTPTNNGYVASLTGLSINRPIIVLNASGTYTVTVNSTAGGKLLAVYGMTWVMYNGTSGVTFAQ